MLTEQKRLRHKSVVITNPTLAVAGLALNPNPNPNPNPNYRLGCVLQIFMRKIIEIRITTKNI